VSLDLSNANFCGFIEEFLLKFFLLSEVEWDRYTRPIFLGYAIEVEPMRLIYYPVYYI
jgi:hypothetical protein